MSRTLPSRFLAGCLIVLAGCQAPVNPAEAKLVGELTTGSPAVTVDVMAKSVVSGPDAAGFVGMAAAADGTVYVADTLKNRIDAVAADGARRFVAGLPSQLGEQVDGPATVATFGNPVSLTRDGKGDMWVCESYGPALVRRVSPSGAVATAVRREALPDSAPSLETVQVIADRTDALYLQTAKGNDQQTIWRVEPAGTLRQVATVSNTGADGPSTLFTSLAAAQDKGLVGLTGDRRLLAITDDGAISPIRTLAPQGDPATTLMGFPQRIAADRHGNVYVWGRRQVDTAAGWTAQTPSWFIQKVDPAGTVTPVLTCRYPSLDPQPFAGIRIAAAMPAPAWLRSVVLSCGEDGRLYVGDAVENRILRIQVTS